MNTKTRKCLGNAWKVLVLRHMNHVKVSSCSRVPFFHTERGKAYGRTTLLRLSEFVTNYCHVLGTFQPVLCGKTTQDCFFVVDVGLANLMALAGNGTSTRRFEVRIRRL